MIRNKGRFRFIHPLLLTKMASGTKEFLSVIVYSSGTCSHIRQCILDAGGTIRYELPFIHAIAAEVPAHSIEKIAHHHMIQYINYDAKVFKCMDIASLSIDSDFVNDAGYTGKGIGIAIVDTGVFPHDDLTKPTNRIIAFKDFVNEQSIPYDDDGHGTHVAGIIAGNGYVQERYKGVAPEANIIAVKALDETGSGNTSDILAALQWIVDNKEIYNIKVVCMSFGSATSSSYRQDPLSQGASALVENSLTAVVAAGNSGPNRRTITSPGTSPAVITVGATDDNRTSSIEDDFIAEFSSRGPTLDGFIKPDVVAPGVDIMSLSNKGPTSYASYSGTSMAAPMVAGAVALLYEKYPQLSPVQIKSKLIKSSIVIERNRYAQGAGIINIKRALDVQDLKIPQASESIHSTPSHSQPRYKSQPLNTLDPSLLLLLILLL